MAVRQWIDKNNYVGDDGALIPDYQKVSFRWPLKGYKYISSYFGKRQSPGGIGSTSHKGIDIPAPIGTPIYAAAGGTVVALQKPSASGGAGYYTMINHGRGLNHRIYASVQILSNPESRSYRKKRTDYWLCGKYRKQYRCSSAFRC